MCQTLVLAGINDSFQGLNDLNLLVPSLAITFDGVKNYQRLFAERVEGDPFLDPSLLALQLIHHLKTRLIPCGLLFFILFAQHGPLLLDLLLHFLLDAERVVQTLTFVGLLGQELLQLLYFVVVGRFLFRHIISQLVQLALVLKVLLVNILYTKIQQSLVTPSWKRVDSKTNLCFYYLRFSAIFASSSS